MTGFLCPFGPDNTYTNTRACTGWNRIGLCVYNIIIHYLYNISHSFTIFVSLSRKRIPVALIYTFKDLKIRRSLSVRKIAEYYKNATRILFKYNIVYTLCRNVYLLDYRHATFLFLIKCPALFFDRDPKKIVYFFLNQNPHLNIISILYFCQSSDDNVIQLI